MTQHSPEKELIAILNQSTAGAELRCAAAQGLGFIPTPSAQQALISLMKQSTAGVQIRSACAIALGRSAGRQYTRPSNIRN